MGCVSVCLHHASEIERHLAPKDWPTALEKVPEECRKECETYLRGIAARLRVKREIERRIMPKEFK